MSDALSTLIGMVILIAIAIGPLALSKRARTSYRFAVGVSIATFVLLLPLVYVGTFLQPPPEAIENPIRTLLTGIAYVFAVVAIGNLAWRVLVMPRFKSRG